MGRLKKKDLLDTIKLLEAVNGALAAHKCGPVINEMPGLCQEAAVIIGEYLETAYTGAAEQTAKRLVRLLEDYCENLYRVSVELSQGGVSDRLGQEMSGQLSRLYSGIEKELPPDKKEVVFLPYKASMWDSLESVWKAATADETADVYVVPLPYYDKNPDGSFHTMHYEGDQYPSYVPVTRYEDYDLEARRPDVIYIHNPYDEYNYVTSVDPCYYARRLKDFTDRLVYIPYFILEEIDPDDRSKVRGYEHFFTVPGVFHADKVFVQSEAMKKVYVEALAEYGRKGGPAGRQYWEQKISGAGSPKVDKVLCTAKEELEIPPGWLSVIQKPDGSRKKIIFYNSTISALLEHNEKMLRKMEQVFEVFRKNSNETALLWRPHPLTESTLASMRPGLLETYRNIRDRYIREGWGIYDDTPDVDRAVILSDAYYGNMSSVLQLYRKTGKPVMVQNVEVL